MTGNAVFKVKFFPLMQSIPALMAESIVPCTWPAIRVECATSMGLPCPLLTRSNDSNPLKRSWPEAKDACTV